MKRLTSITALAAAITLTATVSYGQSQKDETGVTATEVAIGNTTAYSGPLSTAGSTNGEILVKAIGRINATGGVHGRKIILHTLDDGYSPPKTVEQTRRLVERTGVLLMLNPFGTATSAAVQSYLNAAKVPQLFVGSGASRFNDPQRYPWTTACLPDYVEEGEIYAKYLMSRPELPKIAVLYQNDDFGKDLLAGFKKGLGSRADAIVSQLSYEPSDPTVNSQIIALQSSGATVFVNFSGGKAMVQAIVKAHDSGWKPVQIVDSAWSGIADVLEQAGLDKATGIITGQYVKDPGDPAWDNDAGMIAYRELMRKELPLIDARTRAGLISYSAAKVFVGILDGLGDNLSRESIMNAAINLKTFELDTLLPGSTVNTSPTRRNLFRMSKLVRFDGKSWVQLQSLVE
jgi:branched-chain amino acid transport system substrate-binding protein